MAAQGPYGEVGLSRAAAPGATSPVQCTARRGSAPQRARARARRGALGELTIHTDARQTSPRRATGLGKRAHARAAHQKRPCRSPSMPGLIGQGTNPRPQCVASAQPDAGSCSPPLRALSRLRRSACFRAFIAGAQPRPDPPWHWSLATIDDTVWQPASCCRMDATICLPISKGGPGCPFIRCSDEPPARRRSKQFAKSASTERPDWNDARAAVWLPSGTAG